MTKSSPTKLTLSPNRQKWRNPCLTLFLFRRICLTIQWWLTFPKRFFSPHMFTDSHVSFPNIFFFPHAYAWRYSCLTFPKRFFSLHILENTQVSRSLGGLHPKFIRSDFVAIILMSEIILHFTYQIDSKNIHNPSVNE